VIEAKPTVKSQSACVPPGIATVPRSVVQVPMSDGETSGLGGEVSVSVSLPAEEAVAAEEEESESGHSDDDEDVPDLTIFGHVISLTIAPSNRHTLVRTTAR
jgi:hypothetical protein